MVVRLGGLVATRPVAHVVAELAPQRPLDQRLLKGHRVVLDRIGGHRTLDEPAKQFHGELRQIRRLGGGRWVFRARLTLHTCMVSSHAMPRAQHCGQALATLHASARPSRALYTSAVAQRSHASARASATVKQAKAPSCVDTAQS